MARFPVSDLVILAAPTRDVPGWLGVLQDWSALGIVREFIVVDAEAPARDGATPCFTVEGGVARVAVLQQELASRHNVHGVGLFCLSKVSSIFSSIGLVRGGELLQEIRSALPSARVAWVHAIAVAVPEVWTHVDEGKLAWTGAHNVVFAPENSQSPFSGIAQVSESEAGRPLGLTHNAGALCSAAGLWAANADVIFDGEPAAGGGQMVALRTYSRHLSQEGIHNRLLARVVDMRRGFPAPRGDDGRALPRASNESQAAGQMVDHLIGLHDELKCQPRMGVASQQRFRIGLGEMLKRFFRFMGVILRGAPRAFLASLNEEVSRRIAASAQRVLLPGDRSAFNLTVNGIAGVQEDGTIASPEEVDHQLARLIAQLSNDPAAIPEERQEYPRLWKDFAAGALTLLDAHERVTGMPACQVGSADAVVSSATAVAPDPEQQFAVPLHAQSVVKTGSIAPYDDDLARTLHDTLASQHTGSNADTGLLTEIRDWFERPGASYVGQFGRRLTAEIRTARQHVVNDARELRAAGQPTRDDDGAVEIQRSLARVILMHAAVFLALIAGSIFLGWQEVFSWQTVAIAVPMLLVLWLVTGMAIFVRRQDQVFKTLHAGEQAMKRLEAVRVNLENGLRDVRRLQTIYRQYLDWAQVLGVFVREPWGRVSEQDETDLGLGEGFGLNHRFGTVVVDAGGVDDVARRLQGPLFPVGWLTDAWAEFVTDLPAFEDRTVLEEEPELIYTDRPVTARSVLNQWSEAVAAQPRFDVAGGFRARLLDELHTTGVEGGEGLVKAVQWREADGIVVERSFEEFASHLGQAGSPSDHGRNFSHTMFASVTETTEPWQVSRVEGGREKGGIATTLVVTEISGAFGPRDLAFGPGHGRTMQTSVPSSFDGPSPVVPQV